MKNIYILTGEIKSGKTTQLMLWASPQKNIDGILQPVIEGKRFIYHLGSKTLKQQKNLTRYKSGIINSTEKFFLGHGM
jgi:hypothetical protein